MKLLEIRLFTLSALDEMDDFNSARATGDQDQPVPGTCRKRYFLAIPGVSGNSGGASLQFCQKWPGFQLLRVPGLLGTRDSGSSGSEYSSFGLVRDQLFPSKAE